MTKKKKKTKQKNHTYISTHMKCTYEIMITDTVKDSSRLPFLRNQTWKKWNQGGLKWEDKLTKKKKSYDIRSSQKYADKFDINHLAAICYVWNYPKVLLQRFV